MKTNWKTLAALAAVLLTLAPATLQAFEVFSDGFGDADRDNNGIPLEEADVDTCTNPDEPNGACDPVDGVIGTWEPGRNSSAGGANTKLTSVEDASDVGLRWLSHAGFTNTNTIDRKAFHVIVDDSDDALLETRPTSTPGGLDVTAIDDGNALLINSKGRGGSVVAFFDQTIALGSEVGDQVKVSFDWRVSRDAPNKNSFVVPADAALRFGLYQDTDNQLGMTNPVAGRDLSVGGTKTSAVWGQDDGWFEGQRSYLLDQNNQPVPDADIGSTGDAGWFGAVIVEDPNDPFKPTGDRVNGGDWRINEETNLGTGSNNLRIAQGQDLDNVAEPEEMTPDQNDYGLVNLDINKVWNLSLTLERFTDENPGDTILASLTAIDRATGMEYTLSDYERVMISDGMGGMIPDGISSDSWDYFAIRSTGTDDMDYLIDNFKLETFSTANADYDNDGDVDGNDFLFWQRGDSTNGGSPADLALWQEQYGTAALLAAAAAVPEPTSLVLLSLGGVLPLALRRRSRS